MLPLPILLIGSVRPPILYHPQVLNLLNIVQWERKKNHANLTHPKILYVKKSTWNRRNKLMTSLLALSAANWNQINTQSISFFYWYKQSSLYCVLNHICCRGITHWLVTFNNEVFSSEKLLSELIGQIWEYISNNFIYAFHIYVDCKIF